jgi:hypothetical protein
MADLRPALTKFVCPRCEAQLVNETASGAVVMKPPICSFRHPPVEMEQRLCQPPVTDGGDGG